MLVPANETTDDLYTIHKRNAHRFRYLDEQPFFVVLFSDEDLGLAPLKKNMIPTMRHTDDDAEYSRELTDMVPAHEIAEIPMPLLGPFFSGQCARYRESSHPMFAIAAEQLVDGMDLDEEWCKQHMSTSTPETLRFALGLVAGKASRIDYFTTNTVTCFIPNVEERQRLVSVPGRDDVASWENETSEIL